MGGPPRLQASACSKLHLLNGNATPLNRFLSAEFSFVEAFLSQSVLVKRAQRTRRVLCQVFPSTFSFLHFGRYSGMYCSDKVMSRPIVPNTSHLHKVTSSIQHAPTPTEITKRPSPARFPTEGSDTSLQNSSVHSLLRSGNNVEGPVRNNSQLFKTHHTLKLSAAASAPPKNHFGASSINGCDSAVQTRIKNLNREGTRNSAEEPESVVVYRTKNNVDRRALGSVVSTRTEIPEKNNVIGEEKKWKAKYEDAERRRKDLLSESQKLSREKSALEQRLKKLEDDHKNLKTEFVNKTEQLNQLRRVSEQVYQDYDKLNNKYETETTTLHKALEVASKWYKENKKLKRESVALRSSMMLPSNLEVLKDEPDGEEGQGQDELEELRKTVQDLSNQVGQLQSELNKARLQEFEAQEQYVNLSQALDNERSRTEKMQHELKALRLMKEKFESVTYMVHDEMKALRTERDRATERASRLQAEAHQAQKERNVLAHQSSLLMGEISSNETLVKVLMEVEELKRKLEEETQSHRQEVQRLQEKLESGEAEARLEVVEEKLRLAEEELQLALQRAEKAEEAQKELEAKVLGQETKAAPPPPPLPPPPPPPPLPGLTPSAPPAFKKAEKQLLHRESIDDMANILGIQRTPKTNTVNGGAINDIINEIKGGKFTLKATEKQKMKKEEPPPAVQEMLNIIGTLKRRPGRSKPDLEV